MPRRRREPHERLSARNSRLWCVLDVASLRVRAFLVDRSKFPEHFASGNVGFFDADHALIFIGWDLPDEVADATLFHERMHAAAFAHGIDLGNDPEEEAIVNPLAAAEFDTLRRNGWLRMPERPSLPVHARSTR